MIIVPDDAPHWNVDGALPHMIKIFKMWEGALLKVWHWPKVGAEDEVTLTFHHEISTFLAVFFGG